MYKINENGRSMIEMLGVLGIIGVLMIGGVSVIGKTRHRHRLNEITNNLSQLGAQTVKMKSQYYDGDEGDEGDGYANYAIYLYLNNAYPKTLTWNGTDGFIDSAGSSGELQYMYDDTSKPTMISVYGLSEEECLHIATTKLGEKSKKVNGKKVYTGQLDNFECSNGANMQIEF